MPGVKRKIELCGTEAEVEDRFVGGEWGLISGGYMSLVEEERPKGRVMPRYDSWLAGSVFTVRSPWQLYK